MASQTELSRQFNSFPSQGHVENVCKIGQGEASCRYLSVESGSQGTRYSCQKYGELREVIDNRATQGTMRSKGNNCGGMVELIQLAQKDLAGNITHYEEHMPYIEIDGTFDGIYVDRGNVSIGELSISEDFALISVTPRGFTLTARGIGSFVGKETVYFEKPQPSSETSIA